MLEEGFVYLLRRLSLHWSGTTMHARILTTPRTFSKFCGFTQPGTHRHEGAYATITRVGRWSLRKPTHCRSSATRMHAPVRRGTTAREMARRCRGHGTHKGNATSGVYAFDLRLAVAIRRDRRDRSWTAIEPFACRLARGEARPPHRVQGTWIKHVRARDGRQ